MIFIGFRLNGSLRNCLRICLRIGFGKSLGVALKSELFGKLEGGLKLGLAGPTAALQSVTRLQLANIHPCATGFLVGVVQQH